MELIMSYQDLTLGEIATKLPRSTSLFLKNIPSQVAQ